MPKQKTLREAYEEYLARNERELYDFISKISDKLPSYEEFKSEFNQKVKYVKTFKVEEEIKKEIALEIGQNSGLESVV